MKHFFDIPIYRCTPESHSKEIELEKQNGLENFLKPLREKFEEKELENTKDSLLKHFDLHAWYPWFHNEIIGYIRLYILKYQIRGEFWFIDAKQIRRRLKRKFIKYRGEAFEYWCSKDGTSDEIFNDLLKNIENFRVERFSRRNFVIDVELFKRIGPFVDWRKFLDSNNK